VRDGLPLAVVIAAALLVGGAATGQVAAVRTRRTPA
jgi:hypothetical protein